MASLLLFLVFLFSTIFFGFAFSRWVLGERRLFALVPFSIIIGINSFTFFVNVISNIVFIRTSVWLVLCLQVLVALVLVYRWKKGNTESLWVNNFSRKQLGWLFGCAVAISLLSEIVALKALALDDMFIGHIPLAVTIAEGNFPVVDPSAPSHPLSYHYGSDLLSAALNSIAGIPIFLGYDIQTFIWSGSLFLLIFVLLYDITTTFRTAIVGSGLFLFGAGLQWLYFFTKGIPAFWQRFVANENVPTFWKFLSDVAYPKLNTSYIHTMHNHSTAIGMPVLFLVILLYFRSIYAETRRAQLVLSITATILFGYLALNLETYFVIVFLSFITLLVAYLISKKWLFIRAYLTLLAEKNFLQSTLIVSVLGAVLAFFQGGILASLLFDKDRDALVLVSGLRDFFTLNFAPNPSMIDNSSSFIYLFSPDFFIQFGLPLILIIPAIIFIIKKKEGRLIHLFIIGLGAFLIPFLFRLPTRPWEVSRFFVLGMPMFALLVGVYLSSLYERKKILAAVLIFFVGITGVLSQSMFAISSLDHFGSVGQLVQRPPVASPLDARAHAWVREFTTQKDYFFPYDPEFIRHTARFTPGVYPYFTFSRRSAEKVIYDRALLCDDQAFREMNIKYLYLSPAFPIKNSGECLKKLDAREVYRDMGSDGFRSIYEIK
jgi:hypothetical protein